MDEATSRNSEFNIKKDIEFLSEILQSLHKPCLDLPKARQMIGDWKKELEEILPNPNTRA